MSDWLPRDEFKDKIDYDNSPRYLTDEQIEYIVQHYPYPITPDSETAQLVWNSQLEFLRASLSGKKLRPSDVGNIIKEIIINHYQSLISPGESIGIVSSTAINASITQMLFNTFHASGSSTSAAMGVAPVKNIIMAKTNPDGLYTEIHYKDKDMTYKEVLNTREYIVGSTIKDFIVDYKIYLIDNYNPPSWMFVYNYLKEDYIPESESVLRIFFDIHKLYKYKVTLEDIANKIEIYSNYNTKVIYGSMLDGYIDVYASEGIVENFNKNYENVESNIPSYLIERSYYVNIIIELSEKIYIKGIPNMKNLIPDEKNALKIMFDEKKTSKGWRLFASEKFMRYTGLTIERIVDLATLTNLDVLEVTNEYVDVKYKDSTDGYVHNNNEQLYFLNDEIYTLVDNFKIIDNDFYSKISPDIYQENEYKQWINIKTGKILKDTYADKDYNYYKLDNSKLIYDEENNNLYQLVNKNDIKKLSPKKYIENLVDNIKMRKNKKQEISEEELLLLNKSKYFVAIVEGDDLIELYLYEEIDEYRTISTNMHSINAILGIEATRTFIIKTLYESIRNSHNNVHPANVQLIGDVYTNRGKPYGSTFIGISRQAIGPLSLASIERSGETLINSGVFGNIENVKNNVSTSITTGTRMSQGSGYFSIGQDFIVNGKETTFVNELLHTEFKKDDNYYIMLSEYKRKLLKIVEENELQLDSMEYKETPKDKLEEVSLGVLQEYYIPPKPIKRYKELPKVQKIISEGLYIPEHLTINLLNDKMPTALIELLVQYTNWSDGKEILEKSIKSRSLKPEIKSISDSKSKEVQMINIDDIFDYLN